MILSDRAVYTIVQRDRLQTAASKGGSSSWLREGRAWTGARTLLEAAARDGKRVPLLLADAANTSRLTHWALLDDVRIGKNGTRYRFSDLRDLRAPLRTPQELVLSSRRRNIAKGFIRPYALVDTPEFLMPADRSPHAAGAWMELIPARYRRVILRALLESIRHVHAVSPNVWGLTLRKDARVTRLNAGPVEAFIIVPGGVRLLVVGASVKEASGESGRYRSVPDAAPHEIEFADFGSTWRRMRFDHFALLELAATGRSGYSWRHRHSPEALAYLREYLGEQVPEPGYALATGEQDGDPELAVMEGRLRERLVQHREREWRLRERKLQDVLGRTGRLACEIKGCRFDFQTVYGELGSGFAEVHHREPLSGRPKAGSETGLEDLVVVCSNCHRMLHRHSPGLPPDELRIHGVRGRR